jgi:hypothetical protein
MGKLIWNMEIKILEETIIQHFDCFSYGNQLNSKIFDSDLSVIQIKKHYQINASLNKVL